MKITAEGLMIVSLAFLILAMLAKVTYWVLLAIGAYS